MMKRRTSNLLFLVTFLWLAALTAPSETNSIVVPKEQANTFGTSVGFFFSAGGFAQVYDTAEFAVLSVDVIAISAVSFRWDERYTQSINAVAPRIVLKMGVSTYNGANFVDYVRDMTQVFAAKNVQLTGSANRAPSEFDLTFILQKPFVYDRRKGRLILEGSVDPVAVEVDATGSGDSESFFVLPGSSDSDLHGGPQVLVTKFFFSVVPIINSIQWTGSNNIQIDITVPMDATARIEGATSVNGPYLTENNAEMTDIGPNKKRAVLPMNGARRFYRSRINSL